MAGQATMRYIHHSAAGAPSVLALTEGPVPEPSAHEVLIQVAAAGVNRPDVLQRQGLYPPPEDASPVLGLEVSGTVVAVGEGVQRWQLGDRVCALVNGG
ncbi:alcohol dehydrogenase catalytic domain-containing protein, partial [Marinimicrobium sp. UBA4509]